MASISDGETFANCKVFDVDSETFVKAHGAGKTGKAKFRRWNEFVDTESETGQAIRSFSYKNPGQPIILRDANTGSMTFVKVRHNGPTFKA